jgi:hypothetical protein
LELASFLEWDSTHNFAIEVLGSPTLCLSPSMRLSLAISFQIRAWIEPAFKELMDMPSHLFTLNNFTLLSFPICHMILTTQAAIQNHHLLVAYNPLKPPHHEDTCKKLMVMCQCNWDAAWWNGLFHHYLHPDCPDSPQDILFKLENTPIMGVTAACQA